MNISHLACRPAKTSCHGLFRAVPSFSMATPTVLIIFKPNIEPPQVDLGRGVGRLCHDRGSKRRFPVHTEKATQRSSWTSAARHDCQSLLNRHPLFCSSLGTTRGVISFNRRPSQSSAQSRSLTKFEYVKTFALLFSPVKVLGTPARAHQ